LAHALRLIGGFAKGLTAMTAHLLNVTLALIAISVSGGYWLRQRSRGTRARQTLQKAASAGLLEPVSLHPELVPNRCIGIGACAEACPEGDVIGVVDGRAELIKPTRCIGHGACAAACPVDALTLVFGTAKRGVELPEVKETFETDVKGIYIAGELGGMGLIRNAVTQGKQAMEHVAKSLGERGSADCDVIVVGCGPAGIAATLQAKKMGLRCLTLDQNDIGGTVLSYPRQKLVMTQPMELPLFGKCNFREIQKEDLLALWQDVVEKTGIKINTHEQVESVERVNGYHKVLTAKGEYLGRKVLLCNGRRGTPRKLGVPGEESSKVTYSLIEQEQYRDKKVLVVGGGDSAVEAALTLAEQKGTEVTLSYRKGVFGRIKEKNEEAIKHATKAKKLKVLLNSVVKHIAQDAVALSHNEAPLEIPNEYILVFIGGELPSKFLKSMGISIKTKFGER
jgi:thioredoxin reductase/NAD-dependent dihydropyrimidine dehydrogenase PreA subunit